MYLVMHDDGKLKTTEKIEEVITAYRERFGLNPNVILLSEDDLRSFNSENKGLSITVKIRSESHIWRNNFWAGTE